MAAMRVALLLAGAATFLPAAEPEGPFSHARHAALDLPCTYCHAGAETRLSAGMPETATCRNCHTDIAERTFPERERVYEIPGFIFFSHARHIEGGATCRDCHGDIAQQDVIELARPTTMLECIACHQEREASIDCNLCHDLGQ